MTAIADLITPAERDRLAARLAEWRQLDALVRERGGLTALPPPTPLHKMASHDRGHDSKTDHSAPGRLSPA